MHWSTSTHIRKVSQEACHLPGLMGMWLTGYLTGFEPGRSELFGDMSHFFVYYFLLQTFTVRLFVACNARKYNLHNLLFAPCFVNLLYE